MSKPTKLIESLSFDLKAALLKAVRMNDNLITMQIATLTVFPSEALEFAFLCLFMLEPNSDSSVLCSVFKDCIIYIRMVYNTWEYSRCKYLHLVKITLFRQSQYSNILIVYNVGGSRKFSEVFASVYTIL